MFLYSMINSVIFLAWPQWHTPKKEKKKKRKEKENKGWVKQNYRNVAKN